MKTSVVSFLVMIALVTPTAHSHGGRTDASGGHYDRKNGGYHYHNGGGASSAGGTNTQPSFNTGRGESVRTQPRIRPRTESRPNSAIQSLIEDPERKIPEEIERKETATHIPRFQIIEQKQAGDSLVVHVQLDDDPGTERPETPVLEYIITQLHLTAQADVRFFWKRGRYQVVPWAQATFDGVASRIMILQDALDYDVLEQRVSGGKTTIAEIVLYPYHLLFPTKQEIQEIFEELKIEGECKVRFYWPEDKEKKHPAAHVYREKRRPDLEIGLYPRSSRQK